MAKTITKSNARFARFLQPVLDALIALGGSGRPSEVKEHILKSLSLDPEYVNAVHKGGESKFGNDVDWARFYLVRAATWTRRNEECGPSLKRAELLASMMSWQFVIDASSRSEEHTSE